jgi:hypothetical protein
MNQTDTELLKQIAGMDGVPEGAYNIRKDGGMDSRRSTETIEITSKEDKPGIDIRIKAGTKGQDVHIPVLLTQSGLNDLVYNDFFIGEDCDVDIIAGCGIHNDGCDTTQHDGVHTFYVGKRSKVRYTEKHYGEGEGSGQRVMNPHTIVYLAEGASIQLETIQIRGVDHTKRYTKVELDAGAEAVVTERLLTHGEQFAESKMDVIMKGEGARAQVISRSVAQDKSVQVFYPQVEGNAPCFGHVQCDSIIMGQAKVSSIPAIVANHMDAQLIHEAAIGKIAGDQILKLMTLGLTEEEAEQKILDGFLR